MKVIIAGGRDFHNLELLNVKCNKILKRKEDIEIVSGAAKGADMCGEVYAESKGYKLTKFPADWNKHGKAAGFIRNRQMAEYADALIAFWDGKSRGTKNMIDEATDLDLDVRVIKY